MGFLGVQPDWHHFTTAYSANELLASDFCVKVIYQFIAATCK